MPEADKILSQHEVDALLSAIDSGGGESTADRTAEPYDFRRPSRIPAEPLRFLQSIHENFARALQESLSGMLLRSVETRLAGVHQLPLGEFMGSLPHPAVLVLISASPLEGNFLLQINPAIAYPLLERLLGAGKIAAPQRDRLLSPLEWNVADALVGRLLALLAEAWAPVAPVRFQVIRRESDPHALKFEAANEPTVVVALEIAFGDQRGSLEIAFPALAVEPHFSKMVASAPFSARRAEGGHSEEAAISRRLAPAEVDVAVHLPEETVRLKDLELLRPGDLVVTNHPEGGPVLVTVEGRRKFRARLGSLRDRKAVKIVEAADDEVALPNTALSVLKGEGGSVASGGVGANLSANLLQLPLTASVIVAEKTLRLSEVLALKAGEILEFAHRADDPLELRVGGQPVARGTCVRVGERLGLRVTDVGLARSGSPR
jgi:flagellar motor switch protein FliM